MSLAIVNKTPHDVLDFDVDFSRWLPADDTIVSASSSVEEDDATVTIDSTDFSDTAAKVWISGGTDGETATIAVTVTTDGGRTKEACFRLRIKDCH